MKLKNLVSVGNEMNVLLFDEKKKDEGWIETKGTTEVKIITAIKEAVIILEPDDELTEDSLATLREIDWKEEDFEKEEEDDQVLVKKTLQDMGVWLNEEGEEEGEEETTPSPTTKKKAPAKKAPATKAEKTKDEVPSTKEKALVKKKTEKGPRVISTIVSLIEKAGQKGISKEVLLKVLEETFPERTADAMKNTINVQVPGRISREKFELEKTKDGKFRKVKK